MTLILTHPIVTVQNWQYHKPGRLDAAGPLPHTCVRCTRSGLGGSVAVATQRWARAICDFPLDSPLRRGAWYPVLTAGPEEVVLVVRHHAVIVPSSVLEISATRPNRWSLVRRDWALGGPYLVCPNCAARVSLRAPLDRLSCDRCHGVYAVEAHVRSE